MKLKSTGNSENIQRDIVHFHCAFNYRRLPDRLKTVLLTTRLLSPEEILSLLLIILYRACYTSSAVT